MTLTGQDIREHYRLAFNDAVKAQKAKLRLLGADDAVAILAKIKTNTRPWNIKVSQYYCRLMVTGQWDIGEPIILADDGEPLNATHRLKALEYANAECPGIQIPFWVISGVAREAFRSMDTGKTRTGKDILAIAGESHAAVLASACDFVFRYEHNGGDLLSCVSGTLKVSGQERLWILEQNPGLRASAALMHNAARNKGSSPTLRAALHYLTIQKNPQKAADFWEMILERTTVPHGSPVWYLHQKLKSRSPKDPANRKELVVLVTKAWNAFVNDQQLTELRWRTRKDANGKTVPEPCPKLSNGSKKAIQEAAEAASMT